MDRKLPAAMLCALLYAQGLLGFAAVAAVLLKHHRLAGESVACVSGPAVDIVPA